MKNITALISSFYKQEFLAFETLRNLSLVLPLWERIAKVIITLPEIDLNSHIDENFTFEKQINYLIDNL